MNKFFTILLTVAALSVAIPAAARDCALTTSQPELVLSGGLYVDNDVCQPGCILSIVVYEESNGVPGLQRGDARHDDTCRGSRGIPDERVL